MSWDSFWLNGVHFGESYNVWLGSDSNGLPENMLLPENEIYEASVAGMNGAYYYGQSYKPRKYKLDVFAEHISNEVIKNIQQALSFDLPQKLIMDTSPHKYINVIINGQIDWKYVWTKDEFYNDSYSGLWTIPIIAHDPFYYSYYNSLDVYNYYDVHSVFTNEDIGILDKGIPSNIITNINTTKNFDIYNHGNRKAKIIIGIKGSGTNVNIVNNTTQQQFIISSMNNEGIIVNGNKGCITNGYIFNNQLSGVTILKTLLFEGDFIELKPGYNSFSITGTGLNLESVSFLFRHTYV